MPRIYPLFSSSKGNATYIGNKDSGVLIDCGVSFSRLRYALGLNGLTIDCIKAVFITHEHSDHTNGLQILTKHSNIPVFAQKYTLDSLVDSGRISPNCKAAYINAGTEIDGVVITQFDTPHDTRESCGYKLTFGDGKTCAVCTDLGHVSHTVMSSLLGVDAVLLESNYDFEMLKNGRYPWYLKKRIMSDNGHLANDVCTDFAKVLVQNGMTRLILGHLSQENNTPQKAFETMENGLFSSNIKRDVDYILSVAPVQTSGGFTVF